MCANDIIIDPKDIPTATDCALVETYNAMMEPEDHVTEFPSRAVAETRCAHALMVATERCAHAGVPKGHSPWPVVAPRADKRSRKSSPTFTPEPIPMPIAPIAKQLLTATASVREHTPPPRPSAVATNTPKFNAVKATFTGKSTPQPGSVRSAVLAAVQSAPKGTIAVAALDALEAFAELPKGTRSYLQKLIEKEHLVGFTQ